MLRSRKNIYWKLVGFILLPLISFAQPIDLSQMAQDFVLETKQIKIPGHSHAFNPSIVRFQDSILFSFRSRANESTNAFGLIFLDENFNPIGKPQIFDLKLFPKENCNHPRVQDSRLFVLGEDLYISFNHWQTKKMYLAKLFYEKGQFRMTTPKLLENYWTKLKNQLEKNWTLFAFNEALHFVYEINPLMVFGPNMEITSVANPIPNWEWGEYRGGTPALNIGGQFLSFFHSSRPLSSIESKGEEIAHYFMGAFTFSPTPPFTITAISPSPIIGEDFYTSPEYKTWKSLKVIFPCGYLFDDQFFWVVYGKQDHETWVVKLDRQDLLESLKETNNEIY